MHAVSKFNFFLSPSLLAKINYCDRTLFCNQVILSFTNCCKRIECHIFERLLCNNSCSSSDKGQSRPCYHWSILKVQSWMQLCYKILIHVVIVVYYLFCLPFLLNSFFKQSETMPHVLMSEPWKLRLMSSVLFCPHPCIIRLCCSCFDPPRGSLSILSALNSKFVIEYK